MSYGGSPLRSLILRATTRAMIPGVRALHAVPETGDPRPLETTERALSRLDELLSESRTSDLVGDNFTVADLTVCALLAFGVLARPGKHMLLVLGSEPGAPLLRKPIEVKTGERLDLGKLQAGAPPEPDEAAPRKASL